MSHCGIRFLVVKYVYLKALITDLCNKMNRQQLKTQKIKPLYNADFEKLTFFSILFFTQFSTVLKITSKPPTHSTIFARLSPG